MKRGHRYTHTPEHREHIRLALLGRSMSPETCEKIRQARLGYKPSAEALAHMSQAQKGRKHSPESIEKTRQAHLGKPLSPETRAKISKARMGQRAGERSHLWRGGTADERHSIGFTATLKRQIRERDGFTCLVCGAEENGKTHSVHHIDYDKTNHDPRNLVTICVSCHSKTNLQREAWANYFGAAA